MAEYIDRQAAIGLLNKLADGYSYIELPTEDAINYFKAIPSADVEPVRHGRWIWDDEGYHCSECFYHAYGNTLECLDGTYQYCPNCGAKMDGDEVDEV